VFRAIRALNSVGKRNGFVEGIGVQGLRSTKYSSHGFDRGAHDIIEWILLGQ
jgi:hypothetical protein